MRVGDLVRITYGRVEDIDQKGVIAYEESPFLTHSAYADQYRGVLLFSGRVVWTLIYNLEEVCE